MLSATAGASLRNSARTWGEDLVEVLLEPFEGSGVAGAPWTTGVYVTLGWLSPETGDPIKQTITANQGHPDDYDLDYEASEGDRPNRAFI